MSSLAEGADRWWRRRRSALRMPLHASSCRCRGRFISHDFRTDSSRAAVRALCDAAVDVYELPITPGQHAGLDSANPARTARGSTRRSACSCARIATSCWRCGTARTPDKLGGTSQVVRFHHDDVMPGYTPRGSRQPPVLARTTRATSSTTSSVRATGRTARRPRACTPLDGVVVHHRRAANRAPARCRCGTARCSIEAASSGRDATAARGGDRRAASYPLLDRRAGGRPVARAAGHQPGVLRGGLARHPLPEARDCSRCGRPTSARC